MPKKLHRVMGGGGGGGSCARAAPVKQGEKQPSKSPMLKAVCLAWCVMRRFSSGFADSLLWPFGTTHTAELAFAASQSVLRCQSWHRPQARDCLHYGNIRL